MVADHRGAARPGHDQRFCAERRVVAALSQPPRRDRAADAIAAIVRVSVTRPWLVVVVGLLMTVAAGFYAAGHIAINTDPLSMLSSRLYFRQDFEAFKRAFPAVTDNIAVVIDGTDPAKVESAADALYARLRSDRHLYRGVFYPEGEPFFRRNGLLYSSVADLQALSTRLAEAEPMLATLARDPSIRGLAGILRLGIDALGTPDGRPAQLGPALEAIAKVIDSVNESAPESDAVAAADGQPCRLRPAAPLHHHPAGHELRVDDAGRRRARRHPEANPGIASRCA